MKRITALIAALCLLLLPALAETTGEGLTLDVDGRKLTLNFDSSAEYSSVVDGGVLASFYVYTDNSDRLYELTMTFPEDVQPGDVVDTQFALADSPESSVAAIFSTQSEAVYYFAGIIDGAVYPANSSFAITFDEVRDGDSGRYYAGRLSAKMIGMDMYNGPSDDDLALDIVDAPFSFTMPAANRQSAAENPPEDDNPFDTDPPLQPAHTPKPARDEVKV